MSYQALGGIPNCLSIISTSVIVGFEPPLSQKLTDAWVLFVALATSINFIFLFS
nr:MAG TPA: hypothetical protein [Caudoviricetes sp.]